MRLKKLCLAAIAAVAAMASLGTSSATAEETALCSVNQSPCEEGNLATAIHGASGTTWIFSTSLVNVLCLSALAEASALEAGAPQAIDITTLTYASLRHQSIALQLLAHIDRHSLHSSTVRGG